MATNFCNICFIRTTERYKMNANHRNHEKFTHTRLFESRNPKTKNEKLKNVFRFWNQEKTAYSSCSVSGKVLCSALHSARRQFESNTESILETKDHHTFRKE